VSEADFHIQGQNSGAWQELFARVKTDSLT
jgi:hypothetical protein